MILAAILGALFNLTPYVPTPDIPSPIVHGVDVITGLHQEVHTDLVVHCHEPITLYRTRQGDISSCYRLHEDCLWVHIEKKNRNIKLRLEEADGTVLEFVPSGHCNFIAGYTLSCDFELITPVVNDWQGKLHFDAPSYTFTLTKASGEEKIYRFGGAPCLSCDKKGRVQRTHDLPCLLQEIRKPSGNREIWSYDGHLKRIESRSHDGSTLFGWVEFHSPHACTTSDAQSLTYEFQRQRLCRILLNDREVPINDGITPYYYNKDVTYRGKHDERQGRVRELRRGGKLLARFTYSLCGNNRKRRLRSPTELDDGMGHIQRYHFSKCRLLSIEHFDYVKGVLSHSYDTEFHWGYLGLGNLERANGESYYYDDRGNVVQDTQRMLYTYSDDGFNLLVNSHQGLLSTTYAYKPGTDLLCCMELYDRDELKETHQFDYDDNGSLIGAKTFDAGHTYNQMVMIHPRTQTPGLGLPEIIERRTPSGLLGREVLHYNEQNHVICKDVYDANDAFCYSLHTSYNTHGEILSQTDPLGYCTEYQYDERGNCIEIMQPGRTISQSFDLQNQLIQQEVSDGTETLTCCFTYDVQGNCTSTSDAAGHTTTFCYDDRHLVTALNQPLVGTTEFAYDSNGRLKSEQHPAGGITKYGWSRENQISKIIYPDGTTTEFYENYRRHTYTDRHGRETIFNSDYRRRNASKTWAGPKLIRDGTTHYDYDDAGRLIQESSPKTLITYSYDSLGRICCTDVNGVITEYEHDLADQIISIRQNSNERHFTYDGLGRCVACSDGTCIEYDVLGFPRSFTDPQGNTTSLERELDSDQIRTILTDPLGRRQETIYDALGRPTDLTITSSDGTLLQSLQRTFDVCGNCIRQTVDGKTTTWRYGPMNLLLEMTRGADTCNERTTRYGYDQNRQLTVVHHPSGDVEAFTYDEKGRLKGHGTRGLLHTYAYDDNDRITEIKELDGTQTQRVYDESGYLSTETLANGLTLSYELDSQGRRTRITLPDGSGITYSYVNDQLAAVSRLDASGVIQYTQEYAEYDHAGRIKRIYPILGGTSITFRYDDRGCLSQVDGPWYAAQATWGPTGCLDTLLSTDPSGENHLDHFVYDALDRLQDPPTDALYQLTCAPHASCSYDLNGNLVSIQSDKEILELAYDGRHQLIHVRNDTTLLKFTYDPLGRRLSKEIHTLKEDEWVLLSRLRYIWVEGCEIGAVDDNDRIVELRVLALGIAAERWATVAIELDGEIFQPIHDLCGNIAGLLTLDGRVAEWTPFSPFGQAAPSLHSNPWRYASKRADPETGFIYFGSRIYSPSLTRWLTPDPEGLFDGPDLYAYCHNNPLSLYDPDGRFSITFNGSTVATIGGSKKGGRGGRSTGSGKKSGPSGGSTGGTVLRPSPAPSLDPQEDLDIWVWLEPPSDASISSIDSIDLVNDRIDLGSSSGYWAPLPSNWREEIEQIPYLADRRNEFEALEDQARLVADLKLSVEFPICDPIWDLNPKPTSTPVLTSLDYFNIAQPPPNRTATTFHAPQSEAQAPLTEAPTGKIFFVNGMNNSREVAQSHCDYLSELAGGVPVHLIYNHDNGGLINLAEAALNFFGFRTHPSEKIINAVTDFFSRSTPNARILILTHSQGNAHMSNALDVMPFEISHRIDVLAVAPALFIPEQKCRSAIHLRATFDLGYDIRTIHPEMRPSLSSMRFWSDPVPRLDFVGSLLAETVIDIPSASGSGFFDHEFQSPTYKNDIQEYLLQLMGSEEGAWE